MRKRITPAPDSAMVKRPTAESLQHRLDRETNARLQAEALLEQKNLELIESNRALKRELAEHQRSEGRFRDLIELSSDWYWEQDEALRFTLLSQGVLQKSGFRPRDSIGRTRREQPGIMMSEEEWAAHQAVLDARLPFYDLAYRRVNPNGNVRYVSMSGRPVFDEQGRFSGYRGIGRDVTDRVKSENALRESEARFRDLTALSSDWYWEQDENFRFTYLSDGIEKKGGSPVELSLGKTRWEIPNIVMTDEEWTAHKAMLFAHKPFHDLTYKRLGDDGSVHYVRVSGRPVFDEKKRFKGYHGVTKDITDSVLARDRIQYLAYHAYHDGLTALPNRSMFSQLLENAISKALRYNKRLVLLFIDLDRFKDINDTLGHEAGDALLQEVGKRIASSLRHSDTAARLGGDEFVVLLEETGEPRYVARVADKILGAVGKPFQILGRELLVTASIGISIYPDDGLDETTLMKNADIAMYRAKEEGKNNYRFYSTS